MIRSRKDFTGERHGHLVIQETLGYDKYGQAIVRCLCDCGREVVRNRGGLCSTSRCARWNHEILGKRFGHLVVVDYDHRSNGITWFRCRCDCGREVVYEYVNLRSTSHCGKWNHEILGKRFGRLVVVSKPRIDNTSGVRGVTLDRKTGLWRAYIAVAKHRYELGSYQNLEEAAAVRRDAEQMLFDPILKSHGKNPTDDVEWRKRIAGAVKALRERNRRDGMTAKEAAEAAHVGHNSIVRAVKSGLIKGVKIGSRWCIDPESLAEWMRTRSGA